MEPDVAPGLDQPSPSDAAPSNSITNVTLPHRPKPEEKDDRQNTADGGEAKAEIPETLPAPPPATDSQPAKKKPKKKPRGGKKVCSELLYDIYLIYFMVGRITEACIETSDRL